VLAGVGGFFAWRASSLKSDIQSEFGKTGEYTKALDGKNSDMKTANTLALVGFIAGGVALAAGGVLYYFGWSEGQGNGGKTAMLSPAVSGDSAGLLLSGRF
jgi:hypothetical protein